MGEKLIEKLLMAVLAAMVAALIGGLTFYFTAWSSSQVEAALTTAKIENLSEDFDDLTEDIGKDFESLERTITRLHDED